EHDPEKLQTFRTRSCSRINPGSSEAEHHAALWADRPCDGLPEVPPVKLYSYFRSSAAYRTRIALNLKGLPYAMESIHLTKGGGRQHAPEFRAVNPQRRGPARPPHDGAALPQAPPITRSLAATPPAPPP